MLFTFAATSMIVPLVPLFSVSLGASKMLVGFLVAMSNVLPLMFAMSIGKLVDRWGSRGLITAGSLGLSLAPILVVLSPGLGTLAITQVLVGLCHLTLVVAAQSLVASLGGGKLRERNFGWYTTFISAGQLVGPLLAGVLVDSFGYQAAFSVAGALPLASVAVSHLLPRTRPVLVSRIERSGSRPQSRALFGNPGMRMALASSCGILFATSAYQAFVPVYLDMLAFSATSIGVVLSLRAFAAMSVRPLMPFIVVFLGGRSRALLVTLLLVSLGFGATGFAQSWTALIITSTLIGFGWGISQPLSVVSVVEHVKEHERGFALGLRLTGNRASQILSPLLLGLVAQRVGFGAMFFTGSIALVAFSLLIVRLKPSFDTAEQLIKSEQERVNPGAVNQVV